MANKKRIRRKVRRKAPPVRRAQAPGYIQSGKDTASDIQIGGVMDPAEKAADQMAHRALSGQAPVTAAPATPGPSAQRKAHAGTAPVLAPGAKSAAAPKSATNAVKAMGSGRALNRAERAFYESRFNQDFSAVRIHEGARAARATRALDARAFTYGADIAFAPGENTPRTLAHELAHVVQNDGALRRELALRPPGRTSDPPEMSDSDKNAAARFNNQTFKPENREWLLDILGTAGRRAFTPDNIAEVRDFQADWRKTPDGKIGKRSLEPFGRESIAEGYRTKAIWLVVDGHDFDLGNVERLFYDHTFTASNARTEAPGWGKKSTIKIGKPGVDQGYRGMVHTIAHEIDHANVFAGAAVSEPRFEFQGECVEIISTGMLRESVAGLMDDAGRAWQKWQGMSTADKQAMWGTFQDARDAINQRYDALSAARQAPYTVLVNNWRGQGKP